MNFFHAVTAAGYAAAPAPGIVTAGLLISYDPNKAGGYSGSTLFDLAGSEDMTMLNGAAVTLPYIELDGVNDRARISDNYVPSSVQFSFTDTFTYCGWARPDFVNNAGAGVVIAAIQDVSPFRACGIIAGPVGARLTPRFWFRASSSEFMLLNSSVPMDTGEPVYLSATYAGSRSSGSWKFYVNGVSVSFTYNSSGSSPTAMTYAGTTFGIGSQENSNFWNGGIGACQVYDRVLSDAEILQNFNATKADYGL
jgi:hypothetical protein